MFVSEGNDDSVLTELSALPTGPRLIAHIKNLLSGKTPMNSIDKDLLPYSGLMSGQEVNISLTEDEISELRNALSDFQPSPENLKAIKDLPFVQKFGNNWAKDIRAAIAHDPKLVSQWNAVISTDKAYRIWDSAQRLLSETLTDRNRAQIQADMPEYETYLPMFGDAGQKMLEKLRTFVSSLS